MEADRSPPVPFSPVCASFMHGYKPRFAANFAAFSVGCELPPQLPEEPVAYAARLYTAMFDTDLAVLSPGLTHQLRSFVEDSAEAEPVLLKTWMRMINDFVDVLEASSASTGALLELVGWIDRMSRALYHCYFEVSRSARVDESAWTELARRWSQDTARAFAQRLSGAPQSAATTQKFAAHTYLQGVPVAFNCTLSAAGPGTVVFEVEARYAAVLTRTVDVLIEGPMRGGLVVAEVQSADPATGRVVLHRFKPYAGGSDRRTQVRVEPGRPIDVDIVHLGGHSRGTLFDLCDDAVSLYLRNTGIDVTARVMLHFSLPHAGPGGAEVQFAMPGQVVRVRPDRRGDTRAHRVILRLEPTPADQAHLAAYIAARQTEILKGVRRAMDAQN